MFDWDVKAKKIPATAFGCIFKAQTSAELDWLMHKYTSSYSETPIGDKSATYWPLSRNSNCQKLVLHNSFGLGTESCFIRLHHSRVKIFKSLSTCKIIDF